MFDEEQEKQYQEFRLTKSYGKLHSNFDYLPLELVEKYIKKPLIESIVPTFKEKCLIDKDQLTCPEKASFTTFFHHDGTYNVVPKINQEYSMWDESEKEVFCEKILVQKKINNEMTYGEKDGYCILKAIASENITIKLCFSIKNVYKKNFYLSKSSLTDNTTSQYPINNTITYCLFSYDHQWLALTTLEHNCFLLFNLALQNKLIFFYATDSQISALATAHHYSLFIVGCKNGSLLFKTPDQGFSFNHNEQKTIDTIIINSGDTQFIAYGDKILTLWKLEKFITATNIFIPSSHILYYDFPIKKAFFSSNNTIITTMLENGDIIFADSLTAKLIKQYRAEWCLSQEIPLNNQNLLTLCSDKNNLLILLVNKDALKSSLVIRNATNGKLLSLYNFFLSDTIKAIGLTKDENNIVFLHNNNSVALLNLYKNQHLEDIHFIEEKANFYQLHQLFSIKNRDHTAASYVKKIESLIKDYQFQYQPINSVD